MARFNSEATENVPRNAEMGIQGEDGRTWLHLAIRYWGNVNSRTNARRSRP